MSNAAKHTPAGSTITTALTADPAAHTVALSVTDDGPGIPPDLLPTLFERFVRGDSARSHAGGSTSTGLGLAIVDAVTTAHGGHVSVSSESGRTRFTITLPLDGPPAVPARPAEAGSAEAGSAGAGAAGADSAGAGGAGTGAVPVTE
jgi:two-component system OmpR family sensor kinase